MDFILVIAETAFGVNQPATATAVALFHDTDAVGPGPLGYDAVSSGQIHRAHAQLTKCELCNMLLDICSCADGGTFARNVGSAGASSSSANLPTYQNVRLRAGASSSSTNLPSYQNVQLPGSPGAADAAEDNVLRYSAVSTGELRGAESQAGLNAVSMVAVAAEDNVLRYSAVSTGELRDAESQAGLDALGNTALPMYQNVDLRSQNGARNGR